MRWRTPTLLLCCLLTALSVTLILYQWSATSYQDDQPPAPPGTSLGSTPYSRITPWGFGVGKKAPLFALHDAESDQEVRLADELGARPVVLIFDSFT
jgi:hypothetical protein